MIYLSGSVRKTNSPHIGFMLQPGMGNRLPEGVTWAADNGCYSQGEKFEAARWLKWLGSFSEEQRSRCLFATAPDVVGDARATWARSEAILPVLRGMGYKAALVAQDGMETMVSFHDGIGPAFPWGEIDALFIGGSTQWKLSVHALELGREAKRRGKWVHMGRVNSRKRIAMAWADGCVDSCDGTYAAFRARGGGGDLGMREIAGWLSQPPLRLEGERK